MYKSIKIHTRSRCQVSFYRITGPLDIIFSTGSLVDIETRKPINFRGNIHLPGQWWRVIALRTKKARDKKHYPSDMHALTYRLRDDPKRFKDSVVHLLLTKIGNDLDSEKKAKKRKKGPGKDSSVDKASEKDYSIYFQGKDQFYNYLR